MHQLTIAPGEGARPTGHADPGQPRRARLDSGIQADPYLHGEPRCGDQLGDATNPAVIALIWLDATGRPHPWSLTITATANGVPTINTVTGAAAS